jgi:ribosomal-protein-alanine N-acetyltransferase
MSDEQNFIDFKCPHCGENNSFAEDAAGHVRECFNCLEPVIVPKTSGDIGGKLPFPLATERLVLRRFNAEDWKGLMELASDEEFSEFADEAEAIQWLKNEQQVKLTTPDRMFQLAVELKGGNKLIGQAGLNIGNPESLHATLDVRIHKDSQRKGFGSEALVALIQFCFEDIGLHRIAGWCDSRNIGACKLFEKVDLRREGEFLKNQRSIDGEWMNTVWYGMLEEEYFAEPSA